MGGLCRFTLNRILKSHLNFRRTLLFKLFR
nr:MAG TPA: hypothetical protein [Caudoviricetes sp.]